MLAWMNAEALAISCLRTGHLLVALTASPLAKRRDLREHSGYCGHPARLDGDTLLLRVRQHGAGACHTGRRTCFFYGCDDGSWQLIEDS